MSHALGAACFKSYDCDLLPDCRRKGSTCSADDDDDEEEEEDGAVSSQCSNHAEHFHASRNLRNDKCSCKGVSRTSTKVLRAAWLERR